MSEKVYQCWAIETGWRDIPEGVWSLFGIGYFSWPTAEQHHLQGCRTALFATRRLARLAAADKKEHAPHCKAVRVTVTIQKAKP